MATADAGLFHPNVKFRCRVAGAGGSPDKWERMPMCLCAVSQAVRCLGIQQLCCAVGVELSSVAANSHLSHRWRQMGERRINK